MTATKKPEVELDIKLYDPIQIRWIDSFCTGHGSSWENWEDFDRDCPDIITLGYYLQKTDRYMIVAQSKGTGEDTGSFGGIWRIPNSCILDIAQF